MSSKYTDDDIQIACDFETEARELLDRADESIQALSHGDWSEENTLSLFRTAHSLKGASGMLNFTEVVDFIHKIETFLNKFRDKELIPIEGDDQILSSAFSCLRDMLLAEIAVITRNENKDEAHLKISLQLSTLFIDRINQNTSESAITSANESPLIEMSAHSSGDAKNIQTTARTIRVDVEILDRLLNIVGELIVAKNKLRHLKNCSHMSFEMLAQEIGESSRDLDYFSNEIQRAVMRMRLVPIRTVFNKLPRVTNEIAKKVNKSVDIHLEGADTEIDKSLVDSLFEPLVHIIRNSMDHGIEDAEARKKVGKPAKGNITVRAKLDLDRVIVEIEDDGKGINPDKVAEKAIERGLINFEQMTALSDQDKVELVFHPGFSTAEQVSEVSGRGVGMDVVRTTLLSMGGDVSIRSKTGQGTLISLETPAKTGIKEALLVQHGVTIYAVPVEQVVEAIKFSADAAIPMRTGLALRYRGEIIGLETLGQIMGLEKNQDFSKKKDQKILIVQKNGIKYGILVDSVLSKQEIIIKDLPTQLKGNPMIKAATYLWDGREILILDPLAYLDSLLEKTTYQATVA